VHRIALLEKFNCLGTACEDICCQSWGMQVNPATRKRYEEEAPELLDAIGTGEAEYVMKRDAKTGHCVKLDGDNLCSIHKQYGERMLGDACHFYPRAIRGLGDEPFMTAVMSCPEVVRLALADAQAPTPTHLPGTHRLPENVKACLPEGLTPAEALAIHQTFLKAAQDEGVSAERSVMRIVSTAQSLSRVSHKSWPQAATFYLQHADSRLLAPEASLTDPFFLLQALCGTIAATNGRHKPRLIRTVNAIEYALHAKFDWDTRQLITQDDSLMRVEPLQHMWAQSCAAHFAPILKRWLAMQLSAALFPFYGFGATLVERAVVIGVRFATVKLALMSACYEKNGIIADDDTVRIIQTLSRNLDHLADPALSLLIYQELGWMQEGRLRALVGDTA